MAKARKRPSKGGKKSPTKAPPKKGVEATPVPKGAKRGSDLLWVILLTLLAWIHRALFLISNSDRALPFSGFYHGDAETFFRYARAILAGIEYDGGIPFHPPGFAYFLAGVHTVLGAGGEGAAVPHFRVRLLLALVSSLAVGLLFPLIRPYLGRVAALLACGLCLYHFGLYVFAVAPVSEGLYLTLLVAVLLLWSRKLPHPLSAPGEPASKRPWMWGLLGGLLCGGLALVRAESLLLTMVLFAVGFLGVAVGQRERENWRRELAPWILLLVGLGLALLPWTLRNVRTLSAVNENLGSQLEEPLPVLVPVTLYGPINLALANHAEADGTFSRDLMSSGRQSGRLALTDPQHLRFLLHGDAMAWEYIKSDPAGWGRLVLRKWRLLLDAASLGWSQWNWPGGHNGLRRPVDVFVPYSKAAIWWILGGGLIGLAICFRRGAGYRRWAVIVLGLTGCTLFVTAFFFGYARQGLLLVPFWMSLLAVAILELLRLLRRGRPAPPPKKGLRWLLAVAVVLLLVEAWGATLDRRYRATGTTLPGRSTLNPDLTVYIHPLPSRP